MWIRPFLTTSEESQLGQVRGDIQDPTKQLFLYPYISSTIPFCSTILHSRLPEIDFIQRFRQLDLLTQLHYGYWQREAILQ
jgi:hypothetical protein